MYANQNLLFRNVEEIWWHLLKYNSQYNFQSNSNLYTVEQSESLLPNIRDSLFMTSVILSQLTSDQQQNAFF